MDLSPLLSAPLPVRLHALAALGAFGLGAVQLAAPKGTLPHRTLGYAWIALMLVVAVTSFWIQDMRVWGPWSPIHLLSVLTLAMLPLGLYYARSNQVRGHMLTMSCLFLGALVIAGGFTLMPGRIMHKMVFGG